MISHLDHLFALRSQLMTLGRRRRANTDPYRLIHNYMKSQGLLTHANKDLFDQLGHAFGFLAAVKLQRLIRDRSVPRTTVIGVLDKLIALEKADQNKTDDAKSQEYLRLQKSIRLALRSKLNAREGKVRPFEFIRAFLVEREFVQKHARIHNRVDLIKQWVTETEQYIPELITSQLTHRFNIVQTLKDIDTHDHAASD